MSIEYIIIPESFFSFLFFTILVLILILIIYSFRSLEHREVSKISIYYWILLLSVIEILVSLFLFHIIDVYIITGRSYIIGMFWMLLTTIVIGMIMLAIGLTLKGNYIGYIFIIMIIVSALSGFGYIGYRIDFNIEFLIFIGFFEKTYETNSVLGIIFYIKNVLFFTLMVFISTIFEKDG